MARLPLAPRAPAAPSRAVLALITALGVLGALVAPAGAQAAEPPEPVIDSSPRRVLFSRSAAIVGHLEGGVEGQEVSFERKKPDRRWRLLASKPVDSETKVRFQLADLRRTARYRLSYEDPATGLTSTSDAVKIRVRPRLTLRLSRSHLLKGERVRISGRLYPKQRGRRVVLQQKVSGEWRWIAKKKVVDGRFAHRWEPNHDGYRRVRAVFGGDDWSTRARKRKALRVYRRSLATWYGPGFYGNRTACGQRLGTETLGVAHRWLPCGTNVHLFHNGRTISVRVIDRGPYTDAEYDLTQETAERLGFSGKQTVGTDAGA